MTFKSPPKLPVYILISYAYYNGAMEKILLDMQEKHDVQLLIDSGAFTAYRTKKVFTMDGYCAFLDRLAVKPVGYFMLDVIGDDEATRVNYMESLERGYDPIPIVTFNAPVDEVEYYYKHADLISFGGLQFLPLNKQVLRITEFTKVSKGRNYHILGLTGGRLLKHFKPYSCDSSSVSSANRFGCFKTYIGNGNFTGHNRTDFMEAPVPSIIRACDELDLTISEGGKEENWRGQNGVFGLRLNVHAYMKYAADVEKHIGTKMYMAVCNPRELAAVQYVADKRAEKCA